MIRSSSLFIASLFYGAAALAADAGPEVPYPTGYRDWYHVKSMLIGPGHGLFDTFGGIHHLYANREAKMGYAAGKFPDGAVIVFDLLEAKTDAGATLEGPRKVVGVMRKDSKRYVTTGGWGFEGFKGDSQTERAVTQKNAATACFSCHEAQKEADYVFSRTRP